MSGFTQSTNGPGRENSRTASRGRYDKYQGKGEAATMVNYTATILDARAAPVPELFSPCSTCSVKVRGQDSVHRQTLRTCQWLHRDGYSAVQAVQKIVKFLRPVVGFRQVAWWFADRCRKTVLVPDSLQIIDAGSITL